MELSVVVPCYNEEDGLAELHKRVTAAIKDAGFKTYEIILIDDGSSDATLEMMRNLADKDPHIVSVNLSRNFGQPYALTAGFSQVQGDNVFIIDADLQDPPELLGPMYKQIKAGADVVYGQRISRTGETWFKKFSSRMFYRLLSFLSTVNIPESASDFRLMRRRVLDEIMKMPERHRYNRGMVTWVGFKQEPYQFERQPRFAGETKYSYGKLLMMAFDAICSFSIRPLRLSIPFALFGVMMAFILAIVAFVGYFTESSVAGWASLATIISFFAALQFICIGLMGEYIGRIYVQSKGRPLYIIDEVYRGEKPKTKKTAPKTKRSKNG